MIQGVSFNAGLDTEQPAVTSIAKQQRYRPFYGAQSSVKKTYHTIIHQPLWDSLNVGSESPLDQVQCQDRIPQLQTASRSGLFSEGYVTRTSATVSSLLLHGYACRKQQAQRCLPPPPHIVTMDL
jgi:hypothetical protein